MARRGKNPGRQPKGARPRGKKPRTLATMGLATRATVPAVDWGLIRRRFVSYGKSISQLAQEFGIGSQYVKEMAESEGWVDDRAARVRAQQLAEDEFQHNVLLEKRFQAVESLCRIRLKMAERLVEQLSDPEYEVKPNDLKVMTELEFQLREPGWDKPRADDGLKVTIGVLVQQISEAASHSTINGTIVADIHSEPPLPLRQLYSTDDDDEDDGKSDDGDGQ